MSTSTVRTDKHVLELTWTSLLCSPLGDLKTDHQQGLELVVIFRHAVRIAKSILGQSTAEAGFLPREPVLRDRS